MSDRQASYSLDVVFSILQSILGAFEWKFIKIKENSAFHGVSLIFHTLKHIL